MEHAKPMLRRCAIYTRKSYGPAPGFAVLKGMFTIRGRAIQQAVECRPNWRSLVPAKIRFARDALVNKDAGHHPLV